MWEISSWNQQVSGPHVVLLGAVVGVIADVGALWSVVSPLYVAGVLEVGDCGGEFGNFRGVGVCGMGHVLFIFSYICLLLLVGLSVSPVEAQVVAVE